MTTDKGVRSPSEAGNLPVDDPAERLIRLQRITRALAGLLRPDQVAEVILSEAAPELGGIAGAMWLLDSGSGRLEVLYRRNPDVAAMPLEPTELDADLPVGLVARTGQPLYFRTIEERNRLFPQLTGRGSVASFAVLPLFTAGEVAGVIAIGFGALRSFDDAERLFLEALADQAAVAIERWRLHGAEHRAVTRLALLAVVSDVLASSLDYAETLRAVVRMAVPDLADLATVHLFVDDRLRRVALAQRDAAVERVLIDMTAIEAERASIPVLDEALERRRAVLVNGAATAMAAEAERATRSLPVVDEVAVTAVITAPLMARGTTMGVLTLMRVNGGASYTPEDAALADDLARRAAVAIDNAQLHERQREVADLLQKSLLPPSLEPMPHAQIAAAYHPSGGIDVGGDFYDQLELDDGRWIIMVGDVCGTGPSAAATTAQVRHTGRAGAYFGADPAAVMTAVNESLLRTSSSERFCTMIYAEVRPGPDGLVLRVANGGHPFPVIARHDGTVEEVQVRGTLLGVLPGATWEPHEIRLAPGDTIVFYTDGVTEARSTGPGGHPLDFFGDQRLQAALAGGGDAATVVARLETHLTRFAGSPLDDDVAIVALTAGAARPK